MRVLFNPEMLKLARESRGQSQGDLCDKLKITQGTISKFENGIAQPSKDMIENISIALNYPFSFFSLTAPVYPANLIYYRRRVNVPKEILSVAEAKMNIIRINIESMLESVDIPTTNIFSWDVEENGSPEQAANWLRSKWKVPKGRIDNPIKLLEDNGIIIIPFDFGTPKIYGLSMFTMSNHPLIFVNSKMPSDRTVLTIYHETGHIVLHLRNRISSERNIEKEAFLFASEFLIPTSEFEKHFQFLDLKGLANLKMYWKVSMNALLMKAAHCKKITKNQEKYLWAQMSQLGYRTKEPRELDFEIEKPLLLQEIISIHEKDLGISVEELAKGLSISVDDFHANFMIQPKTKLRVIRKSA